MPPSPRRATTVSLRLDPNLHERLRRCADEDGQPVSEIVRELIAEYVAGRYVEIGRASNLLDRWGQE